VPEGTTPEQAQAMIEESLNSEPVEARPASAALYQAKPKTSTVGRQLGLTGRHLIESAADTIGIFSDPIAATMNAFGANAKPARQLGRDVADYIGLPKPENATERVIGDISRLLVGTGGFVKAARTAANYATTNEAKSVLNSIASRPGMQAASSIGAGAAGGAAREGGEGEGVQLLAAVAGGVNAPVAVNALKNAGTPASNYVKSIFTPQIDIRIDNAIKQAGITLDRLPAAVQQSIREDVSKALSQNGDLSPDALRRLADYRTVGAVPRQGNLTLNPATITQEKNLAKLGANSSDPAAQQLANIERQNDITLINRLNSLGADADDDAYSAAQKVIAALESKKSGAKSVIDALYANARNTQGRSAQLDPYKFAQRTNDLLDEALLGGKLPADVRNKINAIAKGEMPFTVDVAEQLKTRLGELGRNTADKSERMALSLVRKSLDETPLLDDVGQEALNAFNQARGANRAWMNVVEKTPALKAVMDGVEPDKFVKDYIIGNGSNANTMALAQLKRVIRNDRQAMDAVRGQIAFYLKDQATSGKADEVANFSAANFGKALRQLGDRKLGLFFTKDEVNELKAIARVASYEKFQPTGSAVNNSNTASTMFASFMEKLAKSSIARKIPMGSELIANPANNVSISMNARNAVNVPNALVIPRKPEKMPPPLWPALGLLTSE
jgi:hypothetical protein